MWGLGLPKQCSLTYLREQFRFLGHDEGPDAVVLVEQFLAEGPASNTKGQKAIRASLSCVRRQTRCDVCVCVNTHVAVMNACEPLSSSTSSSGHTNVGFTSCNIKLHRSHLLPAHGTPRPPWLHATSVGGLRCAVLCCAVQPRTYSLTSMVGSTSR